LGLIADPMPCGAVWSHSGMGFGYRHWPFLRSGAGCSAIFRVNGSYGFRVASQASAEVPSDPSPGVRASVYC
jgi:hypothetical protein